MTRRPTRAPGPPRNPEALRSFAAALKAVGRRRTKGELKFPSAEYWEALLAICEDHADALLQSDDPLALFKQIHVAGHAILQQQLIQARLGGGGSAEKELRELRRLINGEDESDALPPPARARRDRED